MREVTCSGLMRRNQRTRRWIGTALFETVGLVVGLTNGKSPKATGILAQNGRGLAKAGREHRRLFSGKVQPKFRLRHYPEERPVQVSRALARAAGSAESSLGSALCRWSHSLSNSRKTHRRARCTASWPPP